jgi:hypothetical protein
VTWNPAVSGSFEEATEYRATITLTTKAGYTLQGVAANSFTVAGATSTSNDANSGVIIAVFPPTSGGSDKGDSFSISFEKIADEAPILSKITISRSGRNELKIAEQITLDNPEQYTSYEWYYNEIPLSSTHTVTLSASDIRYNMLGTKTLNLEVVKGGVPYSTSISFTVVE